MMTQEEKERAKYVYWQCPSTFQEVLDEINQFRSEKVSAEELEEVVYKNR